MFEKSTDYAIFLRFLPSLRKQPTFREVVTWALAKRRLSNERRNSILITYTTQILVVILTGWKKIPSRRNQSEALPRSGYSTRHQYENSALVSQTSFCEDSSGDLAKRRLFSQAISFLNNQAYRIKKFGKPANTSIC